MLGELSSSTNPTNMVFETTLGTLLSGVDRICCATSHNRSKVYIANCSLVRRLAVGSVSSSILPLSIFGNGKLC